MELQDCHLSTWIAKVYSLNSDYISFPKLVPTSSHMACILYESEEQMINPIGKYMNELSAYKRSEYANKLIGSVFDSLDFKIDKHLSSRSSKRGSIDLTVASGYEDLERLYPKGDNDKTIEKIIKCRIEFDRRERLSNSIFPLVYPMLKQSFLKIKAISDLK